MCTAPPVNVDYYSKVTQTGARDCIAFSMRWVLRLQAAQLQAGLCPRSSPRPSRRGPGSSRVDLKGSRSSPPGAQLLASESAAPVCRSRARTRRPCTRQRAQGVRHRPACPLARADRQLNQKDAGPGMLLASAPSHSTRREGRGLLREGHDQERLFQGR